MAINVKAESYRNLSSHSYWSQRSKIKTLTGLCSLWMLWVEQGGRPSILPSFSGFWGLLVLLGPCPQWSSLCLCFHLVLSMSSPFLLLVRTLTGLRDHLDNPKWSLEVFNLMYICKDSFFFANKGIFTFSATWEYLLGRQHSNHYRQSFWGTWHQNFFFFCFIYFPPL